MHQLSRAYLLLALLGLLAAGPSMGAAGAAPAGGAAVAADRGELLDVAGVLDRLERSRRLSPENGVMLREGLRHMHHFVPMLELSLLELYGPAEVRNPANGLQRLEALLEEGSAKLTLEAERLLHWLALTAAGQLDRERERATLESELEQERLRHLETLKKLEGLRQVERALELEPEPGAWLERPR